MKLLAGLFSLLLASTLFASFGGGARPQDAHEISNALLYQPAYRIEPGEGEVVFRAKNYTYQLKRATSEWTISPEDNTSKVSVDSNVTRFEPADSRGFFRFVGTADEDGVLLINNAQQQNVARLALWTREQLAKAWLSWFQRESPSTTEDELVDDVDVAEPEIGAAVQAGKRVWLGVRFSMDNGALGIGTLLETDETMAAPKVLQPPELGTSSVMRLVAIAPEGPLFLGAYQWDEGAVHPTVGLVRLDPTTGAVQSFLPGNSPLVGSIVTALNWEATANTLWVASDAGMCRVTLVDALPQQWRCWLLTPHLQLGQAAPAGMFPGRPSQEALPAGKYEARWVDGDAVEVVAPRTMEGWTNAAALRVYREGGFEMAPYALANLNAGMIEIFKEPSDDAAPIGIVRRAEVEEVKPPDGGAAPEGWVYARARVCWVARDAGHVVFTLTPENR